jgi:SAM-dependent methyltransferase
MPVRSSSNGDLERLRAARAEADRRYNEALTGLDEASQAARHVRGLPSAPPGPDETRLETIARGARPITEQDLAGGGLRRRLLRALWGLLGPLVERQQAFNEAVSEHLHRNVPAQQRTREALDTLIAALHEQQAATAALHTRLILYAQQITPYVDTKDREFAAVAVPRLTEFADRLLRNSESVAVAHQLAMTVKRELDTMRTQREAGTPGRPGARPGVPATETGGAAPATSDAQRSHKYVGFEDRFRGTENEIRARQVAYLELFEGRSDVLDVGCGRGEFLDLLAEHGVRARGLDLNHDMVQLCRARGLEVAEDDAVSYLRSLPNGALGGLFAAQVVEHLQPDDLLALLEAAFDALRPGSPIVLETINPACWVAFFDSYLRDITHVRPLHPDTLSYLLTATGFQDATVRFSAPCPDWQKLQHIAASDEVARTLNENAEKINRLLFTFMDYAAVARRP